MTASRVRVPLAADSQVRIPVGPFALPLRGVVVMAVAALPALVVMNLPIAAMNMRISVALSILLLASGIAAPVREGIWIGTWCAYMVLQVLLPSVVINGTRSRAHVHHVAGGVRTGGLRRPVRRAYLAHPALAAAAIPIADSVETGLIRLNPGGFRTVLRVAGPHQAAGSPSHATWCAQLVQFLQSLECPAQIIAVVDHPGRRDAEAAFDASTRGWPSTPLLTMERDLAGAVAQHSVRFKHYVILAPGTAHHDGIPRACRLLAGGATGASTESAARRSLADALRGASAYGLRLDPAPIDEIQSLCLRTVCSGADVAVARDGIAHVGGDAQSIVIVTQLPPWVWPGTMAQAALDTRSPLIVSLHLLPVAPEVARRTLRRRVALHRHVRDEGGDAITSGVAMAQATEMMTAVTKREMAACRIAVTVAVCEGVEPPGTASDLLNALRAQGFGATRVTSPGALPFTCVAPGGTPLRRSLLLTSTAVAGCLLPVQGTPLADCAAPLLGMNESTGSPLHLSLWDCSNHNAVIVGSSGAGKSLAAKTLLMRHVMRGARAVVIDPDSEYRHVMNALGGVHHELGVDALNPLACTASASPDAAAASVLPMLSLMAGDEKGLRMGRPIRRLPDEDQGWLFAAVATFLSTWRETTAREPLLHDLLAWLDTHVPSEASTPRQRARAQSVCSRLRRYTQGDRAMVFDRPSTFDLDERTVAIGLRSLALTYAADLTPALAVILSSVLARVRDGAHGLIVLVDEAHRLTVDPDAGEVLGQLVRQARKHGAAVWMCSQKTEDFSASDLGRTLAATASTKLILGAEEASLPSLREVFGVRDEEADTVCPAVPGRGILISGPHRLGVHVVPGPAIMAVAGGRPSPAPLHREAAA